MKIYYILLSSHSTSVKVLCNYNMKFDIRSIVVKEKNSRY